MDIGRATNCDLELEPSGEGGQLRLTQRTSAAVRCAAALAAVELQGAGVVVRRTDNPTRPTAAELQAVYEAGDNALAVPDIALDAGSHIPVAERALAQFHTYRAIGAYLLSDPPDDDAAPDKRRARGFGGLPEILRVANSVACRDIERDFADVYAVKEVALTYPRGMLGALADGPPGRDCYLPPPDDPPLLPWEKVVALADGPDRLAELRRQLDYHTDEISRLLDSDLQQVLLDLAAQHPLLDRYPLFDPGTDRVVLPGYAVAAAEVVPVPDASGADPPAPAPGAPPTLAG